MQMQWLPMSSRHPMPSGGKKHPHQSCIRPNCHTGAPHSPLHMANTQKVEFVEFNALINLNSAQCLSGWAYVIKRNRPRQRGWYGAVVNCETTPTCVLKAIPEAQQIYDHNELEWASYLNIYLNFTSRNWIQMRKLFRVWVAAEGRAGLVSCGMESLGGG